MQSERELFFLLSGTETNHGTRCNQNTNHHLLQISVLPIVPPIATMLSKNTVVDNYDLSSVKCVASGAAPLSSEVVQKLINLFGADFKKPLSILQKNVEEVKLYFGLFVLPTNKYKYAMPDQTIMSKLNKIKIPPWVGYSSCSCSGFGPLPSHL